MDDGCLALGRAAILLAALLPAMPAAAQVSPGPLSRAHASLEGYSHCLDCHGSRHAGTMDEHCVACHREIGYLVGERRGYHGREASKDCAKCHPEHGGTGFDLVSWPGGRREAFDHRLAGFSLEGAHAKLRCGDCHEKKAFRTGRAAALAPGRGEGARFVGLEPACASCHEDIHRGALGQDCARCHAPSSFKIPTFDHAKTAFPLGGRHAETPCAKCHLAEHLDLPRDREGKAHPLFKPLPHAACGDCHRDPHAGRLGTDCARCHNDRTFREVAASAFDHNRTKYPLRGKHAAVACARCHAAPGAAWIASPPHDRCGACHADAHAGTATLGGKPADCGECHGPDGYSPSTITLERHRLSAYPLAGKHLSVACRACHPAAGRGPGRAGVLLRPASVRCADCHADAHSGQPGTVGVDCARCHALLGFKPSTITVAAHAALPFPLDGKHATAPCAGCHRPKAGELAVPAALGKAGVIVRPARECASCHRDPHEGKFGAARCSECHDASSFKPARFDAARHDASAFPLRGAHRKAACAKCHRDLGAPAAEAGAPRSLPFRDPRRACEECHADPHGGQFASRPDRGACASCHDEEAFRPASRFEHSRDTAFPLKGEHVLVPCARCHMTEILTNGASRIIFKPTPRRCDACHGAKGGTTGGGK